jgi:hypothetical protein
MRDLTAARQAVAHGSVVAGAARRIGAANGSMQGATLGPVGYITIHHCVRCRRPNGGADRAGRCEHAASAHIATHRWTTRYVRAPVGPRAARCLALPNPRIDHASGV